MKKGDHLFLVDGSAYIFRAYHALPPLTRKSDGLPVGAVAGFCNMLLEAAATSIDGRRRPTHLAVIFDQSAKTFRNEIYAQYKAQPPAAARGPGPAVPADRARRRAPSASPAIEQSGYEADDLIATYARQAARGRRRRAHRLLRQGPDAARRPRRGRCYDPIEGQAGIGPARPRCSRSSACRPSKVIDVQALAGDTTDNVPGVPGIGIKTAAAADQRVRRPRHAAGPRRRDQAAEAPRDARSSIAEQARISQQLVTLDDDVAGRRRRSTDLARRRARPRSSCIAFLKAMEFTTLTKRVAEAMASMSPRSSRRRLAADGAAPPPASCGPSRCRRKAPRPTAPRSAAAPDGRRRRGARRRTPRRARGDAVDRAAYETSRRWSADAWIAEARDAGVVAFDTETDLARPDAGRARRHLARRSRPAAPATSRCGHRGAASDLLRRAACCRARFPLADGARRG